jgi:hypothetical protein
MAPTQQDPIHSTGASRCYCQGHEAAIEHRTVHQYDERLTEQNEDLDWAIDTLSPISQADVWQKSTATNMLIVLATHGANDHIRRVAASVLANGVGAIL